ncbi:MAG: RidA family protein [Bacillota bacterium]
MEKQIIFVQNAPAAIGPYSQAVKAGNFIFTSGQLPLNPLTGTMAADIEKQTLQSLNNIKSILEAAGSGLGKVVKTTIFLKDLNDFTKVNEIYNRFFADNYPARSCIQVAQIPKDALIEVEAVAVL